MANTGKLRRIAFFLPQPHNRPQTPRDKGGSDHISKVVVRCLQFSQRRGHASRITRQTQAPKSDFLKQPKRKHSKPSTKPRSLRNLRIIRRTKICAGSALAFKPSTIFTGDNLPIMRGINSDSVEFTSPAVQFQRQLRRPHRQRGGRGGVQGHLGLVRY